MIREIGNAKKRFKSLVKTKIRQKLDLFLVLVICFSIFFKINIIKSN